MMLLKVSTIGHHQLHRYIIMHHIFDQHIDGGIGHHSHVGCRLYHMQSSSYKLWWCGLYCADESTKGVSVTWIVPTRGNKVCVGDLLLGLLMVVAIVVLETDVVAYMNNKRFVTRGKGHRTASLYELLK